MNLILQRIKYGWSGTLTDNQLSECSCNVARTFYSIHGPTFSEMIREEKCPQKWYALSLNQWWISRHLWFSIIRRSHVLRFDFHSYYVVETNQDDLIHQCQSTLAKSSWGTFHNKCAFNICSYGFSFRFCRWRYSFQWICYWLGIGLLIIFQFCFDNVVMSYDMNK